MYSKRHPDYLNGNSQVVFSEVKGTPFYIVSIVFGIAGNLVRKCFYHPDDGELLKSGKSWKYNIKNKKRCVKNFVNPSDNDTDA
jgi:hypothetical protein